MNKGKFIGGISITFTSRILQMGIGLIASMIIARILGPEGKGIYALAILLPTMIIRFVDIGIEPATTYHVAQKEYAYKEILGNNIIISFFFSMLGIALGLVIIFFFSNKFFAGVQQNLLYFALLLVPATMLMTALNQIHMGSQQFAKYNLTLLIVESVFVALLSFSLLYLKKGVTFALMSRIIGYAAGIILVVFLLYRYAKGISLRLNREYVKKIFHYGIQAYIGNLIAFLNLRIDLLLINYFMNTKEVGYYSTSVGLVEKLWIVSSVISVVLFPLVAAEKEEKTRKKFTPQVTRSVFLFNGIGYAAIFAFGSLIITLLYTKTFSPAITPLRILILGAFPLSVSKVLSSDIAGRGKPIINTYLGAIVLVLNVILNLLLIPSYGIIGAAWATTISYFLHFVLKVIIYCKISANTWKDVLIPQKTDVVMYKKKTREMLSSVKTFIQEKAGRGTGRPG